MMLKEKFKQWFINDEEDEHYEGMVELVSIEHEKIAKDFAIGFTKWISVNYYSIGEERWVSWNNDKNILSSKELLKIYKSEQKL